MARTTAAESTESGIAADGEEWWHVRRQHVRRQHRRRRHGTYDGSGSHPIRLRERVPNARKVRLALDLPNELA